MVIIFNSLSVFWRFAVLQGLITMKMTRFYPLVLGGFCFLPLPMPKLHSRTKARWWSPPVNNLLVRPQPTMSLLPLSARGVKRRRRDRQRQTPQSLARLNIENSGNMLFSTISLRGISSAQDFYNPAVTLYVDGVPQLSTNTIQALTDAKRGAAATAGNVIWQKRSGRDYQHRHPAAGQHASRLY
jgi:pesticin/yersiniabactin receptor